MRPSVHWSRTSLTPWTVTSTSSSGFSSPLKSSRSKYRKSQITSYDRKMPSTMISGSLESALVFSCANTVFNKAMWADKMSFLARKWYHKVPSKMPASSAMDAVVTAPNPRWLNSTRLAARILSRVFCENKSSVPGVKSPLVASVMGQLGFHLGRHAWVHHDKPERRDQAQQNGRRIPQRQRGAFFVAVQHLVFLRRLVVVIAVAG